MIKRKNIDLFFDGSLNIKRSNTISRKKSVSFFYSVPSFLWFKNNKLQVFKLVRNSIHRKKYF